MYADLIRMSRTIKIGMYLLSLWLLFVLVFVSKVSIDLCLSCPFATWHELGIIAAKNPLPLLCVLLLIISLCFYMAFRRLIQGVKDGPYKIIEIEDRSSDHLVFLATYVIPLVSFGLETPRQIISLTIVIAVIGAIYVKTNLFYANPTLSLLGFKIYTVKFEQAGTVTPVGNTVLIARDDFEVNNSVNAVRLDKNIFFAKKAIVIKP